MAKEYYTTIGLEIHAELDTNSKMFCGCINNPDEESPNVNICPVCLAHPGTLPVINRKAVENVIKVGLALGSNIADFTEFDRKNYFYPDIPKAYQISQYKYPIVSGGKLNGASITRIHLEEDTGLSKHDKGDYSLVDFNRAGVPLMELVTDHSDGALDSAKKASDFAKELQLLLRTLGVSHANLEKGEMRVEPNISVSADPNTYGTKVEVKNLNSFRSVERAIEFEVARMIKLHEDGKGSEIVQETRGWDEAKQKTFSQRSKENANDYRYFPDPDLPKLYLSKAFDIEAMKKDLPLTPQAKRQIYKDEYGIKDEDIETYIYNPELGTWFETVANILNDKDKAKTASNYITSDFLGLKKNNSDIHMPSAENFAELINMVTGGDISSRAAKDILAMIALIDESPKKIAEEKNLIQKSDEEGLKAIVQKVIDENPEVITTYKSGKDNALMSLVGKIMKETAGSANPQIVLKLLKEIINHTG